MTPAELPSYYAACYCEENVWRLLADPRLEGDDPHALFISNPARSVAVWAQRTAPMPGEPVLWDYHVVALARRAEWEVWDLDSRLAFPTLAVDYLAASFPQPERVPAELRPRFRLVTCAELHARFASDRSQMRDAEGRWRAPPPELPTLQGGGETMNLGSWVDTERPFAGRVFDLGELRAWLSRAP